MCSLASYGELDLHKKYLIHPYEKWFICTRYMNVFGFYEHIHIHNFEEAASRSLSASLIVISTRYLLMGKSRKFYLNYSKTEITYDNKRHFKSNM